MEAKIKQKPEDFLVKEVSSVNLDDEGDYSVFRLRKKDYTTERAVQRIAKALNIDRKRIGYAGSKDKRAVTEQSISLRHANKEKTEVLNLKDIELEFLGYSKEPISLGDLEGNRFEIVVRNITESPVCLKRIVNYFGEQRFSTNNAEVGKAIVKKDFEKAVDRMLVHIGEDEKKVIAHLKKHRNDFVGALKRIPWKILKLYVHAYQSRLWNMTAKEYLNPKIKNKAGPRIEDQLEIFKIKLPLIGFASEIQDKDVKQIVEKVMQNEEIDYNDFVIRAIPDLSSAGDERSLYTDVKDLVIGELEPDELNKGKKKIKLTFSLGKGGYATEVVKAMFG